MRILLVHDFYQQPGGEDAVVRHEMALLQSKGHEVVLFSVHNDDIKGILRKAVTAVLAVYNPWARRRLTAALAKTRPDIVHVHNFFPQLSPSVFDACRAAGIPSLMTLHNFRILCPTSFLYHDTHLRERSLRHSCFWTVKQRVYRRSYIGTFFVACMVEFHKRIGTWRNKVDRFIALTDFAKQKFIEGGLPPDRISVKGNFISAPRATEEMGDRRRGALFVGRLSEEKGLTTLIDAWKGIDYPLRIVGDGPLREFCEKAQSEHVACLGRLSPEQVFDEMARAAFLVLPSVWYEMFPLSLAEALAAGLPVIASRLGGLSEMIEDKRTGLIFAAADAADLADKVRWAVAHPGRMREMGRSARAVYENRYTPEANYVDLITIYDDVIECRQRRLQREGDRV
jgi:glycosyltransferase involved in cell wall biosynthesis